MSNEGRNVVIKNNNNDQTYIEYGNFIEFSCDHIEYESGPGNFPVALVELKNGEVKECDVDLIRFIDDALEFQELRKQIDAMKEEKP